VTSRRFILACALAGGCGDSGQPSTGGETSGPVPEIEGTMVDLVMPGLWVQQAADDDPLRDHRPDTVSCPLGVGWLVEPAGLEVNTGACTYASFTQPTLREIVPGAQISLELYHFDLLALEPATAHVAVLLGEHVLFEREIAIPGKAAVYSEEWVADFELPAGSPAVFHLHNHGQNAWTLASLKVEVEDP
jgi:hypothetical protein